MELKGILTLGENVSLTCCEHLQDLKIGDLSLYEELEKQFNLSEEDFFNDYEKQSPTYSLRYVVLDEAPLEDKSFEQQSAEVVIATICGSLVNGCYSEWTCGYGGFDYVINENGHSIFKELENYVGKYIHFKI